MIAQLTGTVAQREANSVVLDVNGVGYLLLMPVTALSSLPEDGSKVTLHTHLAVKEDDLSLYAFTNVDQLRAFKILLSVSGVGPKVGLALLSTLEVSEIAGAVASSDIKTITRVPGIGPKLAQRLCLELGDKMAEFRFDLQVTQAGNSESARKSGAINDVIEGLVGLGYSRPDSRRAAERAAATTAGDSSQLLVAALALLNSK